jgi:pimeloyl-ACP methyl ester carboxylesterase
MKSIFDAGRFTVKFIQVLILTLLTFAGFPQAHSAPRALQTTPFSHGRNIVQTRPAHLLQSRRAGVAGFVANARTLAPNVTSATCPEDWAVCGYVEVPLDRKHPKGKTIQIYFEQYFHTNPGPAESAIFANFGGPGPATTPARDFAQFLFAPNMDAHDLVLIDDRGRGLSAPIDCEELQRGTAPFIQSEIDCAAQLGNTASRYGTGDIAEDTEAVRVALGYDQVDYFGASNGGVDATAYATRFGEHVRSIVLDAPLGTPGLNEFSRLQFRAHSEPRMVRLVCARSMNCASDHPDADAEFARLIRSIRERPVEGDSHDSSGNPLHMRIDEAALLNFVVAYPTGAFTSTGEILAAAAALKAGDPAPLLRLAADGFFTLDGGDAGDPTLESVGALYATGCVDAGQPWDWSDSVSDRKEKYADVVSRLPTNYFAPFSKSAPTGILFSTLGKQCLWWQEPTPPTPVVPHHAQYPHAPTLVLDGDIDNRVPLEETTQVAALFPNSTHIVVAGSGHETIGTQCGINLVSNFIETLHAGDTSCADTPELVWPAVGRFPVLAKDARAAKIDPTRVNQVNSAERKVVTVAVATAIDTLQRSIIGSGTGVCLRGGAFQTDYGNGGNVWTVSLSDCAFSKDVIVNGTEVWGADNSIVADLIVTGPGTAGGTLHVDGFWLVPGPVGEFKVSGMLGGKRFAVLVPEA